MIIKLDTPNEGSYHKMRGGVITYLSEEMVMEHNLRAIESELISVEERSHSTDYNPLEVDFDLLQDAIKLQSSVVGY